MVDCNPKSTPVPPGISLSKSYSPNTEEDKHYMKDKPYHEALGSCIWAQVRTHPDIAFAVSILSHFQSNPGPAHWKAMSHLLTYLKGSINYRVTYSRGGDLAPIGFVDANYAGDIDTCRSTSGYVFTMAGGPVSWISKRQATVVSQQPKPNTCPLRVLLSKFYGCLHSCPRLVSHTNSLLSFTATMVHPSHLQSTQKVMCVRNTSTFSTITLGSTCLTAKSKSYMSPLRTTSWIFLPSHSNGFNIKGSLEHSKWIFRSSSSGGVLKKTSCDHIVYAYTLFVPPFYSFHSLFLLPLFTILYHNFTSLCASHHFRPLKYRTLFLLTSVVTSLCV